MGKGGVGLASRKVGDVLGAGGASMPALSSGGGEAAISEGDGKPREGSEQPRPQG